MAGITGDVFVAAWKILNSATSALMIGLALWAFVGGIVCIVIAAAQRQ
jgi:hypothetical protein